MKMKLKCSLNVYFYVEFKFVEVQFIIDMDICEICGNLDFFLLKLIGDILFYCWFYDQFYNFVEFIVFVVFWENDLSSSEDIYIYWKVKIQF